MHAQLDTVRFELLLNGLGCNVIFKIAFKWIIFIRSMIWIRVITKSTMHKSTLNNHYNYITLYFVILARIDLTCVI